MRKRPSFAGPSAKWNATRPSSGVSSRTSSAPDDHTPKQPRNERPVSQLSKLVPYMLRGKGEERCTWYMAGNLEGLDWQEDAELAVDVMELSRPGFLGDLN